MEWAPRRVLLETPSILSSPTRFNWNAVTPERRYDPALVLGVPHQYGNARLSPYLLGRFRNRESVVLPDYSGNEPSSKQEGPLLQSIRIRDDD